MALGAAGLAGAGARMAGLGAAPSAADSAAYSTADSAAYIAGGSAGDGATHSATHSAACLLVENITRLYPVRVARVVVPARVQDVVRAVQSWPGPVAVGATAWAARLAWRVACTSICAG
jgi:hypothetical protein